MILAAQLLARDASKLVGELGRPAWFHRWRTRVGVALLVAMGAAGILWMRHFDL